MVVVTYEFTVTGTTTVMNSIMMGGVDTTGQIPATTSGDQDSWTREFFIEEPTTITLAESAVCLFTQSAAPNGTTLNVSVGAQGNTAYTMAANSDFELGPHSLVHRIDAGGQATTAFATLGRGVNTYTLKIYASTANVWWNLNGFIILNYTSGVADDGPGVHNHTVHNLLSPSTSTSSQNQSGTGAILELSAVEDDAYWLVGAMMEIILQHGSTGTSYAYSLNAERGAGEGPGHGCETMFSGQATIDNEKQTAVRMYSASRSSVRRHPNDLDTLRLDALTSRSWRMDLNPACYAVFGSWATYHCITFTVSGTVSGSGGGTVELALHRADTGERMLETTRSGNGAYSFTWYDSALQVYVDAYEDTTHTGRSDNDEAA